MGSGGVQQGRGEGEGEGARAIREEGAYEGCMYT